MKNYYFITATFVEQLRKKRIERDEGGTKNSRGSACPILYTERERTRERAMILSLMLIG